MTSNLVRYEGVKTVQTMDMLELAKVLTASKDFPDLKDAAKTFVRIKAGDELGIPPVQSAMNVYMISGKITLSAAMVGNLIKRSGKYNYKIIKLENNYCELEFLEKIGDEWVSVGPSTFSEDDAKRAGLLKKGVWSSWPRNMYFSRALTNGARWFCPDVFGGPIYTPDELTDDIKYDSQGEIISVEVKELESDWDIVPPTGQEFADKLAELGYKDTERVKKIYQHLGLDVSTFGKQANILIERLLASGIPTDEDLKDYDVLSHLDDFEIMTIEELDEEHITQTIVEKELEEMKMGN